MKYRVIQTIDKKVVGTFRTLKRAKRAKHETECVYWGTHCTIKRIK